MAKFSTRGVDELTLSLEQLATTPEETQYSILEAGASALIPRWKETLQSMKRTGQLIESVKAVRKKGETPIVAITPKGKRKGAYTGQRKTHGGGTYQGTNAEVAYVLEYGTPRMAATHWMETTNEEASDEVVAAEAAVWDDYLKSLNL